MLTKTKESGQGQTRHLMVIVTITESQTNMLACMPTHEIVALSNIPFQ